jgi:hypothetical protein
VAARGVGYEYDVCVSCALVASNLDKENAAGPTDSGLDAALEQVRAVARPAPTLRYELPSFTRHPGLQSLIDDFLRRVDKTTATTLWRRSMVATPPSVHSYRAGLFRRKRDVTVGAAGLEPRLEAEAQGWPLSVTTIHRGHAVATAAEPAFGLPFCTGSVRNSSEDMIDTLGRKTLAITTDGDLRVALITDDRTVLVSGTAKTGGGIGVVDPEFGSQRLADLDDILRQFPQRPGPSDAQASQVIRRVGWADEVVTLGLEPEEQRRRTYADLTKAMAAVLVATSEPPR